MTAAETTSGIDWARIDRIIEVMIKQARLEGNTRQAEDYEQDQRISYWLGKPYGLVELVQNTQQSLQGEMEINRSETSRLWETVRSLQHQINQVAKVGALHKQKKKTEKGKGGVEL